MRKLTQGNRATLIVMVPALALFVFLVSEWLLPQATPRSEELTQVRFAMVNFIGEAPVFVAQELGFFRELGVELQTIESATGADSLKRLLANETDFATAADTPIVYAAFEWSDFLIIAGMTKSEIMHGVLARRDHGIQIPGHLQGKRLGMRLGTASDYVLDQFLLMHDLDASDLTIVDAAPEILVEQLISGQLDAILSWEPNLTIAAENLGISAVLFSTVGLKTMDWLLLTSKQYNTENPQVVEKVLAALHKATILIQKEPAVAREIVSRRLNLSEQTLEGLWNIYSYKLYMTESILLNLEDQARWMRITGRVSTPDIPYFLDFIDPERLRSIAPKQVTIID